MIWVKPLGRHFQLLHRMTCQGLWMRSGISTYKCCKTWSISIYFQHTFPHRCGEHGCRLLVWWGDSKKLTVRIASTWIVRAQKLRSPRVPWKILRCEESQLQLCDPEDVKASNFQRSESLQFWPFIKGLNCRHSGKPLACAVQLGPFKNRVCETTPKKPPIRRADEASVNTSILLNCGAVAPWH